MGLLEGKAAAVSVVALAALIGAFTALPSLAQDVILAAAAITAVKIVWGSMISPALQWGREVHAATTSDLPERMERVEGRVSGLEQTLQVYGTGERAAVRGALEAVATPVGPRPARATDAARTGWRE